jgi:hypothetical protein
MLQSDGAPGWAGIPPTWTSSAKDMVTTALGPSRVWATLSYGILNEVYWPSARATADPRSWFHRRYPGGLVRGQTRCAISAVSA